MADFKRENMESCPLHLPPPSTNPLKTFYLDYRNSYGHQIRQVDDLPSQAPSHWII